MTETARKSAAIREAEPRRHTAPARAATNPRKELVREQLLDIAAQMFNTKGYAQTGMVDIAEALGLGRSAIYHYFRSKEEILAALVESETRNPLHQIDDLIRDRTLTPTERMRRVIRDGIVRRLSSGSRFLMLSRLETQIPAHLEGIYNRGRRRILDFYVQCIRDGIAAGEFRDVDPKIAAFAVIGMANWTSRWYSPTGPKRPFEIGEAIADIALHGLRRLDLSHGDAAAVRATIQSLRDQIQTLEQLLPDVG